MRFDRKTNWATLWLLMLSLALLLASSVRIHAHSVEHAHDAQLMHDSLLLDLESHYHDPIPHFSLDATHVISSDAASPEQDLTPKGIVKKPPTQILLWLGLLSLWILALIRRDILTHVVALLAPGIPSLNYYFKPQLRAPPRP